MVQSTGPANAQYLRSLVFEGKEKSLNNVGLRRGIPSSRWAAAAQFALAISLSASQNDLQKLDIGDENNILWRTKDAVMTLQGLLEGKHDEVIEETLQQHQVSTDSWWSALYRIIEGKNSLLFLHY